jgi:hypothetical protein
VAVGKAPPTTRHAVPEVRADIGGCTHEFTADCREANIRFSVGYQLNDTVRQPILDVPPTTGCRQSTPTARIARARGSTS